ncbi:MAG: GspE/PulE family protein, partial [Thermodesulfobacteriota bacterium]
LDRTSNLLTPSVLGFSDKDLSVFNKLIKSTKGIILATGPTGSGKTTTIYSAINTINTTDKNIMTIEDPIEYEIEGIVQSQVNPKAGVTFANALGSILRQDPDLIYVGEIRDLDTADIAMRAALTGHLVLTTLHTNSAVGAIVRLNDIGVDKVLIESALICSFSQRLVRKVCSKCVRAYIPEEGVLKHLRLPLDTQFYKGEGCDACNGIGYRGRTGIFEFLVVDENVRGLIRMGASEDEIMKTAVAAGMKSMFTDGVQKVIDGITTIEEIRRVTDEGLE